MSQSEKNARCENCKFFYNDKCHRRSTQQDKGGYAIWPHVQKEYWCGEFEQKAEKQTKNFRYCDKR